MTCKINERDRKEFRNIDGDPNLIARFRRTRKGEKLVVNGKAIGGEGINGGDYYEIRLGGDGVLYCGCKDYQFRGHASNHKTPGTNYLCKHLRAFLVHAVDMLEVGASMDSEAIIYNSVIVETAIQRLVGYARKDVKVAPVVAA